MLRNIFINHAINIFQFCMLEFMEAEISYKDFLRLITEPFYTVVKLVMVLEFEYDFKAVRQNYRIVFR